MWKRRRITHPNIYQRHPPGPYKITRVLTQLRRATPRPLVLACALAPFAALLVVRFPDIPGASIGSYVSTFLLALPSTIALFLYLGLLRATLSLLVLSIFAYAVESFGVATGFPYGHFYYGDALGPTVAGLVPLLLPLSYAPLVVGAVAASWGGRSRLLHVTKATLILVWIDAVLDPDAASLGFWVWPDGGAFYGVPPSNYAGWLLSGAAATTLLLATGRWSRTPRPTLLDSATISTAFWTAVAALSGLAIPALLGGVLFIYLLVRRTLLRAAK
jgi:bisanhydrobacterioruberin hydratase